MLFLGGRRDAELLAVAGCVAEAVGDGVEDDISSSTTGFCMHLMVPWGMESMCVSIRFFPNLDYGRKLRRSSEHRCRVC